MTTDPMVWLRVLIVLLLPGIASAAAEKPVREVLAQIRASSAGSPAVDPAALLGQRAPATGDDIDALVAELDGPLAPAAQRVLARTTDPGLVPALLRGCERLSAGLKNLTEADFAALPREARSRELNRLVGLETLIRVLGRLRDERALPTLRKFLEYEALRPAASSALSRIGGDATFAELLQRAGKEKGFDLSGLSVRRLRQLVQEIEDPRTDAAKKGRLLQQVKGGRDPAVNALLQELALRHKDPDLRSQAGLALLNSLVLDGDAVDREFIAGWAGSPSESEEGDLTKVWAVYAMDRRWDESHVPALISILATNRAGATRGEAARVLGDHGAVAAVPHLEWALKTDTESIVRSNSWGALKRLTGRTYRFVDPEDVRARVKYLRKFPQDRGGDERYEGEE